MLMAVAAAMHLRAAESAVVIDPVVNVRGQPTIFSEVVTQLKAGDTVSIVEEVTISKPKADEPAKWARIQMPTNTPVWVNALFIDADTKTVKARRLNLRAGTGENYSVVGVLEKGAPVKEIRRTNDWVEIEAPTNAYAFIALNLLDKEKAKAIAAAAPAPTVAPVPTPAPAMPPLKIEATAPPALPPAQPPIQPVVEPEKPAPKVESLQTEPPPAAAPATPPLTPTAGVAAPPVTPAPTPEVTPPPIAPPTPTAEEPLPKRIIRREGIITSAISIQAPTYFGLISPESRKTVNYIYTTVTNYNLKRLVGARVIVEGEESMDVRWPSTPVIKVDLLKIAPQ